MALPSRSAPASRAIVATNPPVSTIGRFDVLSLAEDERPNITNNEQDAKRANLRAVTPLQAAESLWQYIRLHTGLVNGYVNGCIFTHSGRVEQETLGGFYGSLDEPRRSSVERLVRTFVHEGKRDGIEALAAAHPRLLHCELVDLSTTNCRITLGSACKKDHWADLNDSEQSAAAILGYDQHKWENGLWPPKCRHPWEELMIGDRTAACQLGYCADSWNAELTSEESGIDKSASDRATSAAPTEGTVPLLSDQISPMATEDIEQDETRSSSSAGQCNGSQAMSCKAKADAIRSELGFSHDLPMPAVVKQGFEVVAEVPPALGLPSQVSALYAMLFE